MRESVNKITRLKFTDPRLEEEEYAKIFKDLHEEIVTGLRSMLDV